MKKKFLGIIILSLLFFTGCGNKNDDIIQKLKNKVNKLDSYHIEGNLEITNNETTYDYDIDVSYAKDEKYKVSLKNKTNNHEQIILKNNSGVYVLTPALNKSFKFQSEWPYNNSQSYLYQTIITDIENDEDVKVEKNNNDYIITTSVNYANNNELVSQKIYVDKNANIKKVEVLNKDGIVKIKMTYDKFDSKASFKDDYFELSGNMKTTEEEKPNSEKAEVKNDDKQDSDDTKTTSEIFDVAYPLYIPNDTKLASQDTVDSGDRVILTFAGDSSFTLIEQTINSDDELQTIAVDGDLGFINDVIGNIADGYVSWISNGVEYYAVSNDMDTSELLEVVNSMNVVATGK